MSGGASRRPAGAGTVVAWSLYELGATGFAMNLLSLHFPLDVATRVPRGNEKFSVVFGLSMVAVALTAPVLGALADARGKRRLLVPSVLLGVALTALVAAPAPIGVTLLVFALANIAFQSAYVFYNAMLPDVSDARTEGRVSGWGVAAGYVGSLLAMFIALPFVSGEIRQRLPSAPVVGCRCAFRRGGFFEGGWGMGAGQRVCAHGSALARGGRPAAVFRATAETEPDGGRPLFPFEEIPGGLPLPRRPLDDPVAPLHAVDPLVPRLVLPPLRRHPHRPDPDVDLLEVRGRDVGRRGAGLPPSLHGRGGRRRAPLRLPLPEGVDPDGDARRPRELGPRLRSRPPGAGPPPLPRASARWRGSGSGG